MSDPIVVVTTTLDLASTVCRCSGSKVEIVQVHNWQEPPLSMYSWLTPRLMIPMSKPTSLVVKTQLWRCQWDTAAPVKGVNIAFSRRSALLVQHSSCCITLGRCQWLQCFASAMPKLKTWTLLMLRTERYKAPQLHLKDHSSALTSPLFYNWDPPQ